MPASQQQMLLRLAVPALEVFSHGLYTDDLYLILVREAASALRPTSQERHTPDKDVPDAPS